MSILLQTIVIAILSKETLGLKMISAQRSEHKCEGTSKLCKCPGDPYRCDDDCVDDETFKKEGSCDAYCYTEWGDEFACPGSYVESAGGKGDPVMSTVAGEHFDLRAIGSFNLLTLVEKNSSQDVFRVDARIEKAGASSGDHARFSRCATYMVGLSFLGSWTSQNLTVSTLSNELQFFLDGANMSLSEIETNARIKMHPVSKKKFIFQVAELRATVSLGMHRERASGGSVAGAWFRFLNLQMTGVSNEVSKGLLTSRGLLGGDDFEFATHPSSECETDRSSHASKQVQFSDVGNADTSLSMIFNCDIK